jgi:hypothetical protein
MTVATFQPRGDHPMHGIIAGLAVIKGPQAGVLTAAFGGMVALLAQAGFESTVFTQVVSFGGIGVLAGVCLWLLRLNMVQAKEEKKEMADTFEAERIRLLAINEKQLDEIIASRAEAAANREMLRNLCDRFGVAKAEPPHPPDERPSRKAPRTQQQPIPPSNPNP